MQRSWIALFAIALIVAGCGVPQEEHDDVLDKLEATQTELADTERDKAETEETKEGLRDEIASLEERIAKLEMERDEVKAALTEAEGEIDIYREEKGELDEELDELRQARLETEKRLEEYREVTEQLAGMIEAGQLSVTVREGRLVINLDDDILFDSGRTDIRQDGQEALEDLAEVFEEVDDREFLVAGHTDDVPIGSGRFDSNWELSTARAVEVVTFLQDQGVDPQNLAAAGYGEHDPIASNEDEDGRAQNRRIEIVLMPTIDELPELPDEIVADQE